MPKTELLQGALRDLRHAVRAIGRAPRFAAASVLTTALMVGGVASVFTFVYSVILRPLPYPHAERLLVLETTQPGRFGTGLDPLDLEVYEERVRGVELWGGCRPGYVDTVPGPSNVPLTVQTMRVTPGLFELLGIRVLEGRPLVAADFAPGAPPVALIGDDLRRELYGAEANVVGRTLQFDHRDYSYTIVGVTPAGTDVPTNWLDLPFVWIPLDAVAESEMAITVFGRVRDGVQPDDARAEIEAVSKALAAARPATHEGAITRGRPLLDRVLGTYQRLLWVFFAAVTCVLLIGVANLLWLQLARNTLRAPELAMRQALGASRLRIARLLVLESLLLSLAGGLIGLVVAALTVDRVLAALPRGFPRSGDIAFDVPVAVGALSLSAVVGVVAAVVPLLRAGHESSASRLKVAGRASTQDRARTRLQGLVIGAQTATAVTLLAAAAVLMQQFGELLLRDLGFRQEHLWNVDVELPARYQDDARRTTLWTELLDGLQQVPGLEGVALGGALLTGNDQLQSGISRADAPPIASDRDGLRFSVRWVSSDYFRVLGVPFVEGRAIHDHDRDEVAHGIVINERAAHALWPDASPVGHQLRTGSEKLTVVGVVGDFLHTRVEADVSPQMYRAFQQRATPRDTATFVVRTAEPGALEAVKALIGFAAPDAEVGVTSVTDRRWMLLAAERFRAAVMAAFATVAYGLALIGLGGVLASSVAARRREFAVRLAFGARGGDVVVAALRRVLTPVAIGLGMGLASAAIATRVLSSVLQGLPDANVLALAGTCFTIICGAAAASVLPTRAALRVDPSTLMKDE